MIEGTGRYLKAYTPIVPTSEIAVRWYVERLDAATVRIKQLEQEVAMYKKHLVSYDIPKIQ